MNYGNYSDEVINKAVERMNEGGNPKDVADEIRLKLGYDEGRPHWKTVKGWKVKYPMGKQPKSLPSTVIDEVRKLVQEYTGEKEGEILSEFDELRNEVQTAAAGQADRQPSTYLHEELRARCQTRSDEFPSGDHLWMADDDNRGHGFRVETTKDEYTIAPATLKTIVTKRCRFCPYETRLRTTFVQVN